MLNSARGNLRGFTLIEMLFVIAIIGLLSSIVFIELLEVRSKARDTKRKSEITGIRKALALHELEYGKYPEIADWTSLEEDADTNGPFSQAMAEWLPSIPRDPLYGQVDEEEEPYSYQYKSFFNGKSWAIKVLYEKEGLNIIYSSPAIPFALAMDCPDLVDLNFSTGGDAPWQVDETTGHTGTSSAKSGAISDNQTSYWQIRTTRDGHLAFNCKISSESSDILRITVAVKGEVVGSSTLGGGEYDWGGCYLGLDVPAGGTMRIEYLKNESGSAGQDSIWTDNVDWTP